jgi:hypothetical protein
MKRLPPAKRNQLIIIIAATIGAVCLIYFALIGPQKDANEKLARDIAAKRTAFENAKNVIKNADQIATNLTELTLLLGRAEDDLASGDVNAWFYEKIRSFKANYHVEIPSVGGANVTDCDLLPGIPYRQVKVTISGTAFYHDLGKFISDFENNFPHMRMENLSLEPSNTGGAGAEKLAFRLDVIALIKPGT